MGYRFRVLGCGVEGSGFGFLGMGLKVQDLGLGV